MVTQSHQLTIDDFEQMIARGEFGKSRERIDLLRGDLRIMSPAGPNHEDIVMYLVEWSVKWAESHGYQARGEKSVQFTALASIPEPDIVWVKRRRYRRARPTAADVGLIIEVADSSLRTDRGEMAALYAEAGILEYWIANCVDDCLEVHRQPLNGAYQERFIVRRGETVSPIVAPQAELNVTDLFAEE